jgi:hypothetical protein
LAHGNVSASSALRAHLESCRSGPGLFTSLGALALRCVVALERWSPALARRTESLVRGAAAGGHLRRLLRRGSTIW